MGSIKAKWKRAPMDQRRVTSERSAPQARFTRSQRSGALPASLPSRNGRRSGRPLLLFAGVLAGLVVVSVVLVIGIGVAIHAQQQYDDTQWRAAYYGRPTLPFSTLAPDVGQSQQIVGTSLPSLTTPLPGLTSLTLALIDDPRWQPGSATPIETSFDLRSLPTTVNNPPLQTIRKTISCFFITDPNWGTWAQVKIDGVIGWVDSTTITLEAAS